MYNVYLLHSISVEKEPTRLSAHAAAIHAPYSGSCSLLLQKLRLAAISVLICEGEEAPVMLLAPPVVTVLGFRFPWVDMHYLYPPAPNQSENFQTKGQWIHRDWNGKTASSGVIVIKPTG